MTDTSEYDRLRIEHHTQELRRLQAAAREGDAEAHAELHDMDDGGCGVPYDENW